MVWSFIKRQTKLLVITLRKREGQKFMVFFFYSLNVRAAAMRALLAASKDKSNERLQSLAAEAVKEAKDALALRKGVEKISLFHLMKAYQDVEEGKPNVTDAELVPPELRPRRPAPEDEIQGNPLNCCE